MRIEWTETLELSDKEVEIMRYLGNAKNGMYTWYSNDHLGKHPFHEHEARGLISNGFLTRGSDYNFGDTYVYLNLKGLKLYRLIEGRE